MTQVVAVFGATGAQGGSVVRALTENGDYHVRAITRNPDSDKAKQLSSLKNLSIHKADLNDSASVDQVLNGSHVAFLVTDIDFKPDSKETQQGIDLINSAIKNKLKHVIFSGLDHVETVLGKSCPHFDNKAAIEDYGLAHGHEIAFTSIRLPAYFQNLLRGSLRKVGPNNFLITMATGEKPYYLMDVDATGQVVKSILNSPEEYKNKIVELAGDFLTNDEIATKMNQHLGPLHFSNANVTVEQFAAFGFPGAEDLSVMCEYFRSGKMHRDIELTKKLNPSMLNFNDWIIKNKENFLKVYSEKS